MNFLPKSNTPIVCHISKPNGLQMCQCKAKKHQLWKYLGFLLILPQNPYAPSPSLALGHHPPCVLETRKGEVVVTMRFSSFGVLFSFELTLETHVVIIWWDNTIARYFTSSM